MANIVLFSLPLDHDPPALGLDVPPGRQVERHRHPHLGLFQLPQARHIDAAIETDAILDLVETSSVVAAEKSRQVVVHGLEYGPKAAPPRGRFATSLPVRGALRTKPSDAPVDKPEAGAPLPGRKPRSRRLRQAS